MDRYLYVYCYFSHSVSFLFFMYVYTYLYMPPQINIKGSQRCPYIKEVGLDVCVRFVRLCFIVRSIYEHIQVILFDYDGHNHLVT